MGHDRGRTMDGLIAVALLLVAIALLAIPPAALSGNCG